MSDIGIGKLITDKGAKRDAIHVAVAPMVAVSELRPGQRLANGIVDPFLIHSVRPGERYWLFLFPGSVTALRHAWEHPAFPNEPEPPAKARSEADVWADLPAAEPEPKEPL